MAAKSIIFVLGIAFGVLIFDAALQRKCQMPPAKREVNFCPKTNGAGKQLHASMVSTASGTRPTHECIYR